MKQVDVKKREKEILDLVVDSYIQESRPISSSYLCEKYHLPFSSATIRNILESLEKQGYLSHVHTSSGRVPTKQGFKYYVDQLPEETIYQVLDLAGIFLVEKIHSMQELCSHTIDVLANISGYISLMGYWGQEDWLLLRGMRFILDQPEFEDITTLRNLLYALEVGIDQIHQLLFRWIDEDMKILIGDEIGFSEISDCSLIISGLREQNNIFALALLGPMRMNYEKAIRSILSVKNVLEEAIRNINEG